MGLVNYNTCHLDQKTKKLSAYDEDIFVAKHDFFPHLLTPKI